MTQLNKFFGKLPAKHLPFRIKHYLYPESYLYFNLGRNWWINRNTVRKLKLQRKNLNKF